MLLLFAEFGFLPLFRAVAHLGSVHLGYLLSGLLGNGELLLLERAVFSQILAHCLDFVPALFQLSLRFFPVNLFLAVLLLHGGKGTSGSKRFGLFLGETPLLCIAPFLFLHGEFLHLLLVVFPNLPAFFFRAFLEQVNLCLAVLLLEGKQFGSHALFLFLGIFFLLLFLGLVRCSMTAYIRFLANRCSLLFQIGSLFEVAVAFCLQFLGSLVVCFLVVPLYGRMTIVHAVAL